MPPADDELLEAGSGTESTRAIPSLGDVPAPVPGEGDLGGTPATASGHAPEQSLPGDRPEAMAPGPGGEADAIRAEGQPEASPSEPDGQPEAIPADARTAAAPSPDEAPVVDSSSPRTVGRLIADALRAAGVRYAFTVPGESFLGLLEGLSAAGIRCVATRHEGAAAFMAEAHGQLTGRPAACIGNLALGAANMAVGIHTAFADSSPMFALVGGVERASRGREAFQEVDQVAAFGRLAKWSAELTDASEVPAVMATAVAEALGGRPGPVLLSVPEDLLDEPLAGAGVAVPRLPRHPAVADDDVRAVLHLLASAERPVILAGAGVLRARSSNDLVRFAELLHVPIIAAWRRGDVIQNDHPLYLGMAGLGAPPVVRDRLARADAMLVVGCRLGEMTSYRWTIPAATTRWAHVDLVPARPHPALARPDLAVEADARSFLRSAIARLERSVLLADPLARRDTANAADRAAWEEATVVDASPGPGVGVHPGRVVAALSRILPETAILTTDAGDFAGWLARGFHFRRPGTFLGPTSGAMGYGLPAAIAAALVHRDRPVVALVGDGGLGMSLAELETAVREGTRVITVVFDNQQYALIRRAQGRRPGGAAIASDLGPIDFAAVARAAGGRGVRVETDAAFEPALRAALAADGPTLIHLVIDRAWTSVDDSTTGSSGG